VQIVTQVLFVLLVHVGAESGKQTVAGHVLGVERKEFADRHILVVGNQLVFHLYQLVHIGRQNDHIGLVAHQLAVWRGQEPPAQHVQKLVD